jgi:hypothetical protein
MTKLKATIQRRVGQATVRVTRSVPTKTTETVGSA